MLGAARFALDRVGAGQHFLDQLNAFFNSEACTARVLDVEDLERFALAQAAVRQPGVDLVGLATQAHHHHAPEVGVCGVAGQRALKQLHTQAFGVHAAASAMRQSDNAIHIRKIRQSSGVVAFGKMVGNRACGSGRAVHARQNPDVVARGHTPIRAFVAHESRLLAQRFRFHILTNGVVAFEVALFCTHVQVVRVHMLARCDGLVRKANDLVVAAHRLAQGDGACGDFVARRNQAAHGYAVHGASAHELGAGNDHVVRRVQADEGVLHGSIQCGPQPALCDVVGRFGGRSGKNDERPKVQGAFMKSGIT